MHSEKAWLKYLCMGLGSTAQRGCGANQAGSSLLAGFFASQAVVWSVQASRGTQLLPLRPSSGLEKKSWGKQRWEQAAMGLGTERAHTANSLPPWPQLTDWEQPGEQTITLHPKGMAFLLQSKCHFLDEMIMKSKWEWFKKLSSTSYLHFSALNSAVPQNM